MPPIPRILATTALCLAAVGAERTCENDTLIVYASHLLPVLFIVCYVDSRVDGIKHDAGSVDV